MTAIALIGPGLVGREFLRQVEGIDRHLKVIGISSSSRSLVSANSISLSSWDNSKPPSMTPSEFVRECRKIAGPNFIVVDCTSAAQIAEMYPTWLNEGINIATPNKKAFSSSLVLWNSIAQATKPKLGVRYPMCYRESSVGAGLPIISTIKDLIATGDEIARIEGVLSGTLSFIFNEYCKDEKPAVAKKFSEIVLDAKSKGFTEPDPRDDLNGVDVARKVVILARLAGIEDASDMAGLKVENIVPKELQSACAEEFMRRLPEYDGKFSDMKDEAALEGKVLRYVGVVDSKKGESGVRVGRYAKNHPFAQLKGSDNIIAIYSKRYPENPLIVQGAGAGAAVTAHGVLSDVLKMAEILSYGQQ